MRRCDGEWIKRHAYALLKGERLPTTATTPSHFRKQCLYHETIEAEPISLLLQKKPDYCLEQPFGLKTAVLSRTEYTVVVNR
jgi:hypothetical protein